MNIGTKDAPPAEGREPSKACQIILAKENVL